VSSNTVHGEVYSIQYYVIKFVSDLRYRSVVFSTNKTDRHNIAEILLKVTSHTIKPNQTNTLFYIFVFFFFVLCALWCQFLWPGLSIFDSPSVFSNVYLRDKEISFLRTLSEKKKVYWMKSAVVIVGDTLWCDSLYIFVSHALFSMNVYTILSIVKIHV